MVRSLVTTIITPPPQVPIQAHLFERLPDGVTVGVVDGVPEPLEGCVDGLTVLRLEVPLVGCFGRQGRDGCQVF